MNPSLIKMLRFEWKSNFTMWIFNLILDFSVIGLFLYTMSNSSNPSGIRDVYFFIFILLTWLFTLYSYQESTNSQSMQMYHLISVSRNVKFLSKQLITLVAFPLILLVGTFILVSIINFFNLGKENVEILPRSEKSLLWIVIWILGHSISTLLAIVFKKNKVIYAILTFFIGRIVLGIVMLVLLYVFKSIGSMEFYYFLDSNPFWKIIGFSGVLTLAGIFYGISYHLFFRRQL